MNHFHFYIFIAFMRHFKIFNESNRLAFKITIAINLN